MAVPKPIQDRLDVLKGFKFTNEELKELSCKDVSQFFDEMSEAIRRVEGLHNVFIRTPRDKRR